MCGSGRRLTLIFGIVPAGKLFIIQSNGSLRAEPGERTPENAAGKGEQKTLRQQLTNETAAAGADGEPHGDLAMTEGSPGQQQVGHIGAGDQQHQTDAGQDDVAG